MKNQEESTPQEKLKSIDTVGARYSCLKQDFIGCTETRRATNETVIVIDTSTQLDKERWNCMPSIAPFPHLERLVLNNSRYIRSIHESVSNLQYLKELSLVGCYSLQSLDPAISKLQSLEVVCKNNFVSTGVQQLTPLVSIARFDRFRFDLVAARLIVRPY